MFILIRCFIICFNVATSLSQETLHHPSTNPYQHIPTDETLPRRNIPFDKAEQADVETGNYPTDRCQLTFDAATNLRNELYFIKGTKYWRVRADHEVLKENELSNFWLGFPNISHVDAVFTSPEDQSIIFISGSSYWNLADPNEQEPQPKPISDFGVRDGERVRAAFFWAANERIYIIGTRQYWSLTHDLQPEQGYPRKLSAIKGLPRNIDAAIEDLEGDVYFLQGGNALKFHNLAVERDHALNIPTHWFGCADDVKVTDKPKTTSKDVPVSTGGSDSTSTENNAHSASVCLYLLCCLSFAILMLNSMYF